MLKLKLRKRIEEADKFLLDPKNLERIDQTGIPDDPEYRHIAVKAIGLMFEERDLLEAHGVDWRPYQPE